MNATNTDPPSMTDRIVDMVKVLRDHVPECVAAGAVDMATGMLPAVEAVDNRRPDVLDLPAAATLEVFQGPNVVTIEEIWKERRVVRDDRHYSREIPVFARTCRALEDVGAL